MQTVSPNFFCKNLPATIKFYEQLGFTVAQRVPDDGEMIFALMVSGEVTFMFQTFASAEGILPYVKRTDGGSLLLYIKLKGIRRFFESISDKVTILSGLEKTFYGATEFSILDNNGYMLTFAEDE